MLVSLRSSLLVYGRLCGSTRLKSTSSRGRTKPSSSPPPAVLALLAGDKTVGPSKRFPNAFSSRSHRSQRPGSRPRLNLQSEETNDAAREVANTIHGLFQRLPWSPPPRKRVSGPLSAIRPASTPRRRPPLRTLAAIHSDRLSGIKILFPATPAPPRLDLSNAAGTLDESATWSTADLVAAVGRVAVEPAPLDGSPLQTMQVQLASVGRLQAPDQAAFRPAFRQLFFLTRTAEDAIEVANWLIRVTAREANASELLYESIVGLAGNVNTIHPRPPPEAYLSLFANHAQRISSTFFRNPHPLVLLLEVYTRLFFRDRRRLDPVAQSPPPAVVDEIDRLRQQHLDAVRAIHQAMREATGNIFTQRSTNSLMNAYDHAKSFADVQDVWAAAIAEGGTGINAQGVSIYFDACGFNGALSPALAAWKELQETGFPLHENNYASYHECLTRCGAWDDLAVSFEDQQTRHLADPTGVPPLSPPRLAATVKLANRLVKNPRHRSLHPVDLATFKKLHAELRALAGPEMWAETERLMQSKEPLAKASKIVPRISKPVSNPTGERVSDHAKEVGKMARAVPQTLHPSLAGSRPSSPRMSPTSTLSTQQQPARPPTPTARDSDGTSSTGPSSPETPKLPFLDLSAVVGTLSAPATWTTADLVAAVKRVPVRPASQDRSPLQTMQVQLASVGRLQASSQGCREALVPLFALARTAEEVVEVANWLVRVTRQEANASRLFYATVNGLVFAIRHIRPVTAPAPYLAFLSQHKRAVAKAFWLDRHPLLIVLEVHVQLFRNERDRLDPVAQSPSAVVLDELERLRLRYLDAVQLIRLAMGHVGPGLYTRRSAASLMDAYSYGRSFTDAHAIWTSARSEHGVGVDQQIVSIYFDACGFLGALSEALAAWKELRQSNLLLDENNYSAYQECLTRCGAWTELFDAIRDQQTRHAADPASAPPTSSSQLAHTVKLANRLVKEPRHRSLHPVNLAMFMKLRDELDSLAGPEMWAETKRMLQSNERLAKASKTLPQRPASALELDEEEKDADAPSPATESFPPPAKGPLVPPPPLWSSGSSDANLPRVASKSTVVVPLTTGRLILSSPPLAVPAPPRSPAIDPSASASPVLESVATLPPSPIVQPVVVPVDKSAKKLPHKKKPSISRRVSGLAKGVNKSSPPGPPAARAAHQRTKKEAQQKGVAVREVPQHKPAGTKKTVSRKVAAKKVVLSSSPNPTQTSKWPAPLSRQSRKPGLNTVAASASPDPRAAAASTASPDGVNTALACRASRPQVKDQPDADHAPLSKPQSQLAPLSASRNWSTSLSPAADVPV